MRDRLLEMIRILNEETDENHPISTAEFIELLGRVGVETERKSIQRNVELLIDRGYDIIEERTNEKRYYLGSRDFEEVEVRLLIDAVLASSFITEKKTEQLVSKLLKLVSRHQSAEIKRHIFIDNRVKASNEYIYYCLESIHKAIDEFKRIKVTYTRGGNVKEFEISPYAVAWNKDRFYLIGNIAKHDNLIHLRLDRITAVTVLDIQVRPFNEVCEYKDSFDSADYIARHINMFGGKTEAVEFSCTKKGYDLFFDEFGKADFTREKDGKIIVRLKTATGTGMVSFLAGCGEEITVLSPDTLIEDLKNHCDKILKMYK